MVIIKKEKKTCLLFYKNNKFFYGDIYFIINTLLISLAPSKTSLSKEMQRPIQNILS